MKIDRPEPGSAWHRHCPDAWPRSWLENGKMPDGFRVASASESDLICGKLPEAGYLKATGQVAPSKSSKSSTRKPSAAVLKLRGWNQFFETTVALDPRLPPLAVAVWCWLWKCEWNGEATTSERKLGERFGKGRTPIRAALKLLEQAGFLDIKSRGQWNRTPTVYRVYSSPVSGSILIK